MSPPPSNQATFDQVPPFDETASLSAFSKQFDRNRRQSEKVRRLFKCAAQKRQAQNETAAVGTPHQTQVEQQAAHLAAHQAASAGHLSTAEPQALIVPNFRASIP